MDGAIQHFNNQGLKISRNWNIFLVLSNEFWMKNSNNWLKDVDFSALEKFYLSPQKNIFKMAQIVTITRCLKCLLIDWCLKRWTLLLLFRTRKLLIGWMEQMPLAWLRKYNIMQMSSHQLLHQQINRKLRRYICFSVWFVACTRPQDSKERNRWRKVGQKLSGDWGQMRKWRL